MQDVSCIVCFGSDIYYKAIQHFHFSCTSVWICKSLSCVQSGEAGALCAWLNSLKCLSPGKSVLRISLTAPNIFTLFTRHCYRIRVELSLKHDINHSSTTVSVSPSCLSAHVFNHTDSTNPTSRGRLGIRWWGIRAEKRLGGLYESCATFSVLVWC